MAYLCPTALVCEHKRSISCLDISTNVLVCQYLSTYRIIKFNTQIGKLLNIPGLISNLVEPIIGILADVWKRRVLILGGGIVFAFSLLMISQSTGYIFLLLAFFGLDRPPEHL